MRKKRLLFLLVLSFVCNLFAGDVYLVKDGKAQGQIIVAPNSPRMTLLAAEELRDYVQKISGAKLNITNKADAKYPVNVYVGESEFTRKSGLDTKKLEGGAFRIASGKNWMALLGNDSVYSNRDKEYYPKGHGDKERAKKAWYKETGGKWGNPFHAHFKSYNKAFGIWEGDGRGSFNAVNYFLRSLGVRWYMPGKMGEVLPKSKSIKMLQVNKTIEPEVLGRKFHFYYTPFANASKDELMWRLRLAVCPADTLSGHGIKYILAPKRIKTEHPEYFAIWNGKREFVARGGQPCLSSEGLFKACVEFAKTMYDKYGYKKISMMPPDAYTQLCECELCKDKGTPERGWDGQLSDYVWGFVNRVAKEVYKTHPDLKITCSPYSTYLQVPEKIDKLSPNVEITICQHRSAFDDPAVFAKYQKLRADWLKKLTNKKFSIWDYYLEARPGRSMEGVPAYYPNLIGKDLKSVKGKLIGDGIETARSLPSKPRSSFEWEPGLSFSHVNIYITSRLWWDSSQNVDELLNGYCRDFYGPAAKEMKAFISFCEAKYKTMLKDPKQIEEAFKLLEKAKKAAGENNVYCNRIKNIESYMKPMKALISVLKNKHNGPGARIVSRKLKAKIDGKLDDALWKKLYAYPLKDLKTRKRPKYKTTFKIVKSRVNNTFCIGIRCEDPDTPSLNIGTTENNNSKILNGDTVELLIETTVHSYYQLVINPAGAFLDIDRKNGINSQWSSGAKAAAFIGDGYWSAEIEIPITSENQEELNPDYGVSGKAPTKTYPWFFNVCRQRIRKSGNEFSAFSPTGGKSFHDPTKFGSIKTPK